MDISGILVLVKVVSVLWLGMLLLTEGNHVLRGAMDLMIEGCQLISANFLNITHRDNIVKYKRCLYGFIFSMIIGMREDNIVCDAFYGSPIWVPFYGMNSYSGTMLSYLPLERLLVDVEGQGWTNVKGKIHNFADHFDGIDKNHDSVLTLDEVTAFNSLVLQTCSSHHVSLLDIEVDAVNRFSFVSHFEAACGVDELKHDYSGKYLCPIYFQDAGLPCSNLIPVDKIQRIALFVLPFVSAPHCMSIDSPFILHCFVGTYVTILVVALACFAHKSHWATALAQELVHREELDDGEDAPRQQHLLEVAKARGLVFVLVVGLIEALIGEYILMKLFRNLGLNAANCRFSLVVCLFLLFISDIRARVVSFVQSISIPPRPPAPADQIDETDVDLLGQRIFFGRVMEGRPRSEKVCCPLCRCSSSAAKAIRGVVGGELCCVCLARPSTVCFACGHICTCEPCFTLLVLKYRSRSSSPSSENEENSWNHRNYSSSSSSSSSSSMSSE
mmetsp:Transcript_33563/g.39441  ORF Transcript_33563/g.39441 Transcript_33563/m.39441 type:complete len:501 (-) Transcript_33563:1315-2817(-)